MRDPGLEAMMMLALVLALAALLAGSGFSALEAQGLAAPATVALRRRRPRTATP